jgi:D-arabinose 1-dehydrogenase-like Zn-dependent alcohol dehydrogenase
MRKIRVAQAGAATGVRPMIEAFPLERVADAYERMMTGKVRFRSVLRI